ncbi:MAG: hypothetical protein IPO09_14815 [Anaeromyxobacter sp.]|nr:hypothetical protein [Anaeromyxobacter sp.]
MNAPAAAEVAGTIDPADVVPLFRGDLLVEPGPTPVISLLSDPAGGKRFPFYEFELSVARMLDGRRRAGEVLQAADRLGIPVDLDGLSQFVRQLGLYGFLAAPGTPHPATEGARRGRQPWDEETRTLYRAGVRLMHLGRPKEAAGYFTTILEAHPENSQATQLLAAIGQGLLLEAHAVGARRGGGPEAVGAAQAAGAHAAGARKAGGARRVAPALAATLALVGAVAWLATRQEAGSGAPPPGGAPGSLGAAQGAAAAPAHSQGRTPGGQPGAAAAARVAAEAVAPTTRWRSAPLERRWRPVLATVTAPAAGRFTWRAELARGVRQGEPLGTLLAAGEAEPPTPEAQARLAELTALAAGDPVYREFLEREQERLGASRRRGREVAVTAPAAGPLHRVAADAASVARGEVLAQLLDPASWRLLVELPGEGPPAGAACEVAGDAEAERAPCRLLTVRDLGGRQEVTVAVESRAAPWLELARAPWLRLGPPPAAAQPPSAAPRSTAQAPAAPPPGAPR